MPLHLKEVKSLGKCRTTKIESHLDLLDSAKLFYLAVGMCADTLILNVEVFFKGNLLLLTPIDRAEAATKGVVHSITTSPATTSAAVATTVTTTITITIAVRLGEEVSNCQAKGGDILLPL
jgi:hypothetical protein